MSGWIKLKRSLLEWEWYSDHNATRLLVHLLVSVNYEDKRWRGIMIKAGSMALSWETLSEGSGLSVKQCRVAMDKLEKSGEVGRERAGNFQVVSLVKWDKIQSGEKETDEIGHGKGRRGATTKEYKEVKEEKTETGIPSLGEVIDFFDSKGYDSMYASKVFEWYQYRNWEVNNESILKKWRFQMINQWMKTDEGKKSDKPKFKDLAEFLEAQNGMDTP